MEGSCSCKSLFGFKKLKTSLSSSSRRKSSRVIWVYILAFMVLFNHIHSYNWNELNEEDDELYREKRGKQSNLPANTFFNSKELYDGKTNHRTRNTIFHTCLSGGEYLKGFTLEGGTRAGNYTQLGDAETLNECATMCCRIPSCKQALFLTQPKTGYQTCFQVTCYEHSSCKAISDSTSDYRPQLFRRGYSENHHKRVATAESENHSIISNGNKLDEDLPTLKRDKRGKGFCGKFNGNVCSKHIDLNAMYYHTNKNNTDLDQKLKKPIKLISNSLIGKCRTIALQAICYRFYPQCISQSHRPIPVKVCEEECSEVLSGDCSEEFEAAHLTKYLQRVIPGCSDSHQDDDDEDEDEDEEGKKCIHLKEVFPIDVKGSTTNKTSLPAVQPSKASTTPVNVPTNTPPLVTRFTLKLHSTLSPINLTTSTIVSPNTENFAGSGSGEAPTSSTINRKFSATIVNVTSNEDQETSLEEIDSNDAKVIPRNTTLPIVRTILPISKTTTPVPWTDTITDDGNDSELRVSAGDNAVLTLPDNKITLYASAWPKESKDGDYKYQWSQISAPFKSHGEIEGKNSMSLKLTKLDKVGLYTFKLEVTSSVDNKHGTGFVNITVKHATRKNKPPRAEVFPKDQTITLPTSTIILDASKSTDDDKIVSYKWEELKGPIKENTIFTSSDKKILELKNLVAGVYKFKLTVTDSNGETDSTEARVDVKKEQDYPPEANAGNDMVIRLPNNSVVLNGGASKDDKGKLTYAWRKTSESPICDLIGTGKVKLQVSHMVVGTYVFVLKVTDSRGQSSEAQVKVVVLPEENTVPVAIAGDDKEIVYPDDSTTLDGSKSKDNSKISSYLWEKISGPESIKMVGATSPKVHLTDLKPGTYVIKLTVTDDKKLTGSDTVKIHVKKDHNDPPKAVAGKDQVVYLPSRTISIDGSLSHDDGLIDAYKWTRTGLSPAAGTVVNSSDEKAILRLTDLVKGQYTFHLVVTDNKGLTGADEVSIFVKENPFSSNLVEMYLAIDISKFTEEDKKQLVRKISVLLEVGSEFVFVQAIGDLGFKKGVKLVFYVKDPNFDDRRFDGKYVADILKQKVGNGGKLFDITMLNVEPYVCRKKCSGHGYCDHVTKKCVCNAFWTGNIFKANFGERQSNCDWSILYMSVVIFAIFLVIVGTSWTVCFCLARKKRNLRRARYRALRSTDPDGAEDEILMVPKGLKNKFSANSLTFSDSEDESDDMTVYDKKQPHRNNLSNSKIQKYMDRAF